MDCSARHGEPDFAYNKPPIQSATVVRPFRTDDIPALFDLFRGTVHRVNSRNYTPEQVHAWAPGEMNAAR